MFLHCLLQLSHSAIPYDYLYRFGTANSISFSTTHWFSGYSRSAPGIKLNFLPIKGGADSKTVVSFHSEYEAKQYLKKILNDEEFEKVSKRLILNKYTVQLSTMSSKEEYKAGIYKGRYFEIYSKFLSIQKSGTVYKITYAPYISSLYANTFVYDPGAIIQPCPKERVFELNNINNKKYLNSHNTFLGTGGVLIDSPYPVILRANLVEIIFDRLYSNSFPERIKFLDSLSK